MGAEGGLRITAALTFCVILCTHQVTSTWPVPQRREAPRGSGLCCEVICSLFSLRPRSSTVLRGGGEAAEEGPAPPLLEEPSAEISTMRRAIEEAKRRRRSGSPTRGRPEFNATADREMRARKMLEDLRIKRHQRFDAARNGTRVRSKSAPSPVRPAPAGGIADFAGSGGWHVNSVSNSIWASEGGLRNSGDNSTVQLFNWSSLVSTAAIKTSASHDVLSHLRGGGEDGQVDFSAGEQERSLLSSGPRDEKGQRWDMKGWSGEDDHDQDQTNSDEREDTDDSVDDGAGRRREGSEDMEKVEGQANKPRLGMQDWKRSVTPAALEALEPLSADADASPSVVVGSERGISGKRVWRDLQDCGSAGSGFEESSAGSVVSSDPAVTTHVPGSRGAAQSGAAQESVLNKAKNGDVDAQVKVGLRLISAPPQKRNVARGLIWLKRAARAGSARAAFNVASICASSKGAGEGAEWRNDTVAMKYLRVACTRGYPPALYHLGARHLQGLGVDRSEAQAERLWRQAASLGNGDAMYRLGLLLLDRAQAVDVGLTTHSQAGDAIALNASTAEWTDGMALLEKAAKQGHVDAKFALGAMILGGLVNKSSDGTAEDVRQKRGVRLVREAAEEGVPGAQAAMARLLLEGRHGVSKDLVHAAYWVGQAANAGDAHSQLLYGCMYLDGFHYELKTAHKDARGNIRAQPGAILQARIS